jgi:hypothetical protein
MHRDNLSGARGADTSRSPSRAQPRGRRQSAAELRAGSTSDVTPRFGPSRTTNVTNTPSFRSGDTEVAPSAKQLASSRGTKTGMGSATTM